MKIFVIDDDPGVIKGVRLALEEAGYNVFSAGSGEGLEERLKQVNPDLIILDLVLPGESGFKIAKEIKSSARYKDIPIIMMSLKKDDIDKHIAAMSGAIEYLEKPVNEEQLLFYVKDILSRKETR